MRTGVVLLQMGGPDELSAVEPFLRNLFSDNDIIPLPLGGFLFQAPLARLISSRRARFVRGYYERIGGRSPIADITRAQAEALEHRLDPDGSRGIRCYVAMRYWHPFSDEALARMRADGIERIVALTLFPHYTTATTGSSLNDLRLHLADPPDRGGGLGTPEVVEVDRYYDDPIYLDAMTETVLSGLEQFPEADRAGALLLFSAHGLPVSFIAKGDPYVDHLHVTIAGIVARLTRQTGNIPEWLLSFQSRAGPTRWLEPATDDTIRRLAREGRRDVLAIPISFVSDHIETLYEIDLLFGEEATELGLRFRRAPTLNTSPRFIEALAGITERALARFGAAKGAA